MVLADHAAAHMLATPPAYRTQEPDRQYQHNYDCSTTITTAYLRDAQLQQHQLLALQGGVADAAVTGHQLLTPPCSEHDIYLHSSATRVACILQYWCR